MSSRRCGTLDHLPSPQAGVNRSGLAADAERLRKKTRWYGGTPSRAAAQFGERRRRRTHRGDSSRMDTAHAPAPSLVPGISRPVSTKPPLSRLRAGASQSVWGLAPIMMNIAAGGHLLLLILVVLQGQTLQAGVAAAADNLRMQAHGDVLGGLIWRTR